MSAPEITQLIQILSRLPGLGPRSGRRLALHLLKRRESALTPLMAALASVDAAMCECPTCGNIDTQAPCALCSDPRRRDDAVCVVEDVSGLWALDNAGAFDGRFHVLGGTLSPLDGVGPDDLRINELINRIDAGGVREIVLALPATVDGQTTAHYLQDRLDGFAIEITSLAQGVPMGGDLDYLDNGTLVQAMRARRPVSAE